MQKGAIIKYARMRKVYAVLLTQEPGAGSQRYSTYRRQRCAGSDTIARAIPPSPSAGQPRAATVASEEEEELDIRSYFF